MTRIAWRAIAGGMIGGAAMIPFGVAFKLGGQAVNVYGELVVRTLLGRVYVWALVLEHFLVSAALALPLLWLMRGLRRVSSLVIGLAYGAVIWAVLNSLLLPLTFGRPTPWEIGWPAIWPSLVVHLVYGLATAVSIRTLTISSPAGAGAGYP